MRHASRRHPILLTAARCAAGNLVLYSSQVANLFGQSYASAIFATATYGASPAPFSLVMQPVGNTCCAWHTSSASASRSSPHLLLLRLQDCGLELLNGINQTIFSSGTTNKGTGPCQLQVSGAGGGGFAVVDSTGATLYSQGAYRPAGTLQGTLPANAVLTQVSLDPSRCVLCQRRCVLF